MLIFNRIFISFMNQFSKCDPTDFFFRNLHVIWNNSVCVNWKFRYSVGREYTLFRIINNFAICIELWCISVNTENGNARNFINKIDEKKIEKILQETNLIIGAEKIKVTKTYLYKIIFFTS